MPLIFFDLDAFSFWTRKAVLERMNLDPDSESEWSVTDEESEADFHVHVSSSSFLSPIEIMRERIRKGWFIWDTSDFPAGIHSGLYCSLPTTLFDPRRHQSFCYNIQWNECIRSYQVEQASRLFSFVGGLTSGLRQRLALCFEVGLHEEYEFVIQSGPWASMFDRSGLQVKKYFANSLRSTKFVLCPRGNGVASIRLFEAMEAQRVPVIISDRFVCPDGINWDECSVRVRECDIKHLREILKEREPEWRGMARRARKEWEANFGPSRILENIGSRLSELNSGGSFFAKPKAFIEFGRAKSKVFLPKLVRSGKRLISG